MAKLVCDKCECCEEFPPHKGPREEWFLADAQRPDGTEVPFTACGIHQATVEAAVQKMLTGGNGTVRVYHSAKNGDYTDYGPEEAGNFHLMNVKTYLRNRHYKNEQEQTRKALWLLDVRVTSMGALKKESNVVTCALSGKRLRLDQDQTYGVILRRPEDPEGDALGVIFFDGTPETLGEAKTLTQRLLRMGEIAVCDYRKEKNGKVVKTIFNATNAGDFLLTPARRLLEGRTLRGRYEDQIAAAENTDAVNNILANKGINTKPEAPSSLTTNLGAAMQAAGVEAKPAAAKKGNKGKGSKKGGNDKGDKPSDATPGIVPDSTIQTGASNSASAE